MILPRLGNHHHHDFGQAATGVVQHLHRVVEVARVRTVRLDHRKQFFQIRAEQLALHHALPGEHPIGVAAERVDFPVVRHKAVGNVLVENREWTIARWLV